MVLFLLATGWLPQSHLRPPTSFGLADPELLHAGGSWWVFGTNDGRYVPVTEVAGMWQDQGITDAMPTRPAWARALDHGGELWAPSVIKVGSNYVLYFAARHRRAPVQRPSWCIGTAVATQPQGPYAPARSPLFCGPTRPGTSRHSRLGNQPQTGT